MLTSEVFNEPPLRTIAHSSLIPVTTGVLDFGLSFEKQNHYLLHSTAKFQIEF